MIDLFELLFKQAVNFFQVDGCLLQQLPELAVLLQYLNDVHLNRIDLFFHEKRFLYLQLSFVAILVKVLHVALNLVLQLVSSVAIDDKREPLFQVVQYMERYRVVSHFDKHEPRV